MKRAAAPTEEPLVERIRRAEAAIARRDSEFVRELDAVAAQLPRLARRAGMVVLVAAAGATAISLFGRRRTRGRVARDAASTPARPTPAARPAGVLAVVSLLSPLLPLLFPAWRAGWRQAARRGAPLPRFAQLSWPLLQWWLERSGRPHADRHAVPDAIEPRRRAGESQRGARR